MKRPDEIGYRLLLQHGLCPLFPADREQVTLAQLLDQIERFTEGYSPVCQGLPHQFCYLSRIRLSGTGVFKEDREHPMGVSICAKRGRTTDPLHPVQARRRCNQAIR